MSTEGYAKLSNALHRNEKMIVFGERHPRAFVIWTMAISASSDNQTDGFVSELEAKRFLGAKKKDVVALESEGLWEKTVGGWFIHDYLSLQNSSEKIAQARAKNAERQSKYRRNEKKESNDSNENKESVTRYVTPTGETLVTDGDNTLVTQQKKLKEKEKKLKEREEKENPSPSDDVFDWRAALEEWHPKPEHYQTARDQLAKGYEFVEIPEIERDFRLSVLGKANSYGYRDFDAVFTNWIIKRSHDQKPKESTAGKAKPAAREVSEADIQDVLTDIALSFPQLEYLVQRRAVVEALGQTRSKKLAAEMASTMLVQEMAEVESA